MSKLLEKPLLIFVYRCLGKRFITLVDLEVSVSHRNHFCKYCCSVIGTFRIQAAVSRIKGFFSALCALNVNTRSVLSCFLGWSNDGLASLPQTTRSKIKSWSFPLSIHFFYSKVNILSPIWRDFLILYKKVYNDSNPSSAKFWLQVAAF